jgi:hypothetical protein
METVGQPRHKDDTKTFEELSYPEQAKSISSQLINLGRAIRHHAMDREEATEETRRKCLEQVDRFRTRLARRLGFLVSVLVVLLVSAAVSAAPLKKLAGVNRAAKALIAAMPDLDAKTLESKLQDFRTEILWAEDEVKARQEKEALAKFKEADDPFTMGILIRGTGGVFGRR